MAATPSPSVAVRPKRKNEERGWSLRKGGRRILLMRKELGFVCEGGSAAPTTASSTALRRLWRRSLRREEREIEIEGWGRRGDVG